MSLADQRCIPCRGGVPPLKGDAIKNLLAQIPGWEAQNEHHLFRVFRFPDHHPDLQLAWGKVEVTIYTHKINGLTESDFVLAAKLDRIA